MSSPSIICILTVSFSESSPLSPSRNFLPPFSSLWPLTSQGPPAYAASAGLLSNQILTVKVCPSQPIIPASPDTCGCPCSQTSVPSYLTLFCYSFPHFSFVPTTPNAEGRLCRLNICFSSCAYWHPCFVSYAVCPSFSFSILCRQMVFPRYEHGFLSSTADHHAFHRHLLKVEPDLCRPCCFSHFLHFFCVSLASISSSGSLQCCVAFLFWISKRG